LMLMANIWANIERRIYRIACRDFGRNSISRQETQAFRPSTRSMLESESIFATIDTFRKALVRWACTALKSFSFRRLLQRVMQITFGTWNNARMQLRMAIL